VREHELQPLAVLQQFALSGGDRMMPMKLNGNGEAYPLEKSSESSTTICVRDSGCHFSHPVIRG
jgi:hypothetical protein